MTCYERGDRMMITAARPHAGNAVGDRVILTAAQAGSAVDDRMMLTAAGRECCRRSEL